MTEVEESGWFSSPGGSSHSASTASSTSDSSQSTDGNKTSFQKLKKLIVSRPGHKRTISGIGSSPDVKKPKSLSRESLGIVSRKDPVVNDKVSDETSQPCLSSQDINTAPTLQSRIQGTESEEPKPASGKVPEEVVPPVIHPKPKSSTLSTLVANYDSSGSSDTGD